MHETATPKIQIAVEATYNLSTSSKKGGYKRMKIIFPKKCVEHRQSNEQSAQPALKLTGEYPNALQKISGDELHRTL